MRSASWSSPNLWDESSSDAYVAALASKAERLFSFHELKIYDTGQCRDYILDRYHEGVVQLAQHMVEHQPAPSTCTGELCPCPRFSLAEILVLVGTAGASGMTPPSSTRISARMKCVQEHSSPVNM